MKQFYKYLLLIVICQQNCFSQSSITNTSISFNDKIESDLNSTRIDLFDIEFNGDKFPISINYNHSGVKINDAEGTLGFGWNLQPLGFIETVVNGALDFEQEKGWFFNNPSNFGDEDPFVGSCSNYGCSLAPYSFYDGDLAPDIFSTKISNGIHFDFAFYKDSSTPVFPVVLNNSNDYIINPFYDNFKTTVDSQNTGTVFNIIDNRGNNYDFISGITLQESNRNRDQEFRNNFYLKSVTNPGSSGDFLNVDYYETDYELRDYYSVGLNRYLNNNPNTDYNGDIINNVVTDEIRASFSRNDIMRITTKKLLVEFAYADKKLDKIYIKDTNGNLIGGYEFRYISLSRGKLLNEIRKFDASEANYQTLYVMDYFTDIDHSNLFGNPNINYGGDFFGYPNNSQWGKPFPFQVRLPNGTLQSASNLNPSLYHAKQLSLQKITNKYNGSTEFNYQLKTGTCKGENVSLFYGGGLVLESKLISPVIGKKKLTKYEVEDLNGLLVNTSNPKVNYLKELTNNFKFWSSRLELTNTETLVPNDSVYMNHSTLRGNFFKKITIKEYDYGSMLMESKRVIDFIPDYEGINFMPRVKKETFYNSSNSIVQEKEYNYNQIELYTISGSKINYQTNFIEGTNGNGFFLALKKFFPIYINKVKLKNLKNIVYNQNGPIINNVNYYYQNQNWGDVIEMKTEKTSEGDYLKTMYTYPHSSDPSVVNEPYNSELKQFNILKAFRIENFKNTDKLFEVKTVYSMDSSTGNLLQPKSVYGRKGSDTNSALERRMEYTLYDKDGNVLQLTQENGTKISFIWGYNNTKMIAKIENIAYSSIPSNLITDLQSASDSGDEIGLLTAFTALRNSSQLANTLITTNTYLPLVGISSTTDARGEVVFYNYDNFGRLLNMKDQSGNLIMEKQYNYTIQN